MGSSFELFGLDTATSILLILAFLWALGIVVALVVILVVCITRRCRRARQERAMPPSVPTDNLIPPIYFTEQMQDPLRQEDLREGLRA